MAVSIANLTFFVEYFGFSFRYFMDTGVLRIVLLC